MNTILETPSIYEWVGPTGHKFRDGREPSGTYYHDTTPRAVIDGLERALAERCRIQYWYGDPETGKVWGDEREAKGHFCTVGRSMGPIKIALEIKTRRSMGGGGLLCDCIVKLIVEGREVYKHPTFTLPPKKDPA